MKEEVIEGNRLIAEFMGFPLTKKDYKMGSREFVTVDRQFLYHSSWDWLMPVVEKIREIGFKFIIGDSNRVTVYNKDYDWRNGTTSDSMLDCVWHGCTQFIKWYNHQNKQQ